MITGAGSRVQILQADRTLSTERQRVNWRFVETHVAYGSTKRQSVRIRCHRTSGFRLDEAPIRYLRPARAAGFAAALLSALSGLSVPRTR